MAQTSDLMPSPLPTDAHADHGGDDAADQRRRSRIEVDLPARYRSTQQSLDGRVRDLSPEGVRFVSKMADAIAGAIDLELDLPDDDSTPLRLHGEVRWRGGADGGGMGIRFTGLSTEERRRLANFVIFRTYRRP